MPTTFKYLKLEAGGELALWFSGSCGGWELIAGPPAHLHLHKEAQIMIILLLTAFYHITCKEIELR